MRIGTQSYFESVGRDMSRFQAELGDLTVRLSSGKRVLTPSDDPNASLAIAQAKTALAASGNRKLALETGRTLCRATDAALATVSGSLTEAVNAALAVVDSTGDEDGRAVAATQVRNALDTVFTAANTQSSGRYIFGGYQDQAAPFQRAGTTTSYVGDSGEIAVPVGESALCAVAIPGDRVFNVDTGSGYAVDTVNASVFETMEQLASALEEGRTTDASGHIEDLQALRDHVNQLRGDIGGAENRVEASHDAALDVEQQCHEIIESRESIDLASAITDYSALETNYQALLSVVSRISQMPTLFDLLG